MTLAIDDTKKPERSDQGYAQILAIGTANPPFFIYQRNYADFYFKVTDCEHMTELKQKFNSICEKTTIEKRHGRCITEEILKENPTLYQNVPASLDCRQALAVSEIPKLGEEAALKAIEEWGQPKSSITHLVMCSFTGADMPGADHRLAKLLGLNPAVKRYMFYLLGCYAGGTVLRLAKDLAENNKGSRVLVVCSELPSVSFRGPYNSANSPATATLETLIGNALFGDGSSAVIVGSNPDLSIERPIFELVWASQTILPDSDGAIEGHLTVEGQSFHVRKDVPYLISKNIGAALDSAFSPLGVTDWNSLFWIAHPGGPAILDRIEAEVGLEPEKLRATRRVLKEYGNMSSATVLFVLDEMRKRSFENGEATTGEGLELGVLFGFGPGITVETVVLRSVPFK